MTILTSIFSKLPILKILFTCSESDDECAKCHGSYNDGQEWLCCLLCHPWYQSYYQIILIDYINRLSYLLITFIYRVKIPSISFKIFHKNTELWLDFFYFIRISIKPLNSFVGRKIKI